MNESGEENDVGRRIAKDANAALARRRANSALYGCLLGIWLAACIIVATWCEQLLWRIAAAHVAQPPLVGSVAISKISQQFGLSREAFLAVGLFAFATIGAATGCVLAMLGQRLRMDPHRCSRRALFDAIGQWRSALLWAMPVLLVVLIVMSFDIDRGSPHVRLGLYATELTLALLSPFLVFNRAVLEYPSSSRLWHPEWPGWRIVTAGALIGIIEMLFGFALDVFSMVTSPFFKALTEPAAWLVGGFASAMVCAAWIDREGFRGLLYPWRAGRPWRIVGPFLALTIRLGIVMLWLAPLILIPAFLLIFIVPSIASALEGNGEMLPRALRWLQMWGQDGLMVLFAFGTMVTFATGRTHVLASSMPAQRDL
jgi:hypothetical protein